MRWVRYGDEKWDSSLPQPCFRLTCFVPEFPIVFDGNVSFLLKLKYGIDGQLLAGCLPEGLGPFGLARVLLLLEVLVAFAPAKFENLKQDKNNSIIILFGSGIMAGPWNCVPLGLINYLAIISDELDALARVAGRATEVALFNSHPVKLN